MKYEFTQLVIPEVQNRLQGAEYEQLKRKLVALMLTQRLQVFADQASRSEPWAPLSSARHGQLQAKVDQRGQAVARELASRGMGGVKMLQDTGVLRQSFTSAGGPGNAKRVIEIDQDEVALATNVEYARIQNEGGTIHHPGSQNGFGRGIPIPAHSITIPARPFDEFTDENLSEVNELVEAYLNG
jgi:phage gpG-like protein